MDDARKFKGIWIPAELWLDRNLNINEKIFLIEIDSLSASARGCYKSNAAFAEFFGLSKSRVSEIINGLAAKGLLDIKIIRDGKQIVERRIYLTPKHATEKVFENPTTPPENPTTPYSENRRDLVGNSGYPYSENAAERDNTLSNTTEGISPRVAGAPIGEKNSTSAPRATKPKKHGSDEDHKAARWIFGKVLKLGGDPKEPNWDAWANDIRLTREQDGRTHREICELFDWANRDEFWRTNILAPSKLRKQWDTLAVKRLAAHAPKADIKLGKFDPLAFVNQKGTAHVIPGSDDYIDGQAVRIE
ncbi:helix-turn-helix domain-containing protein [Pseudomonas sp.]|jgi:hypothetical protein|uniref:helix-turn-helix domain-containing protein n=1 Tax=Pseudomonas sp. TaxID=306 RepID=UPI002ED7A4F8